MKNWLIEETVFEKNAITANGNRFLCGNGYMGIRGTLEEYQREHLPAVNLAGVYDKVGDGWREPVNAPNPLYTRIKVNGEAYMLPEKEAESHKQQLDYRHGLLRRNTVFRVPEGTVTITSERFVHMGRKHLIGMSYYIMTDFDAELEVCTGIDGEVWDINGPHLDEMHMAWEEDMLLAQAVTHEKKEKVIVAEYTGVNQACEQTCREESGKILRSFCFRVERKKPAYLEKLAVVYTGKDCDEPLVSAKKELADGVKNGYDCLKREHTDCWEELWKTSEVEISGDEEAERALNYSLYHLLSIAPFQAKSQSIPARGLSGQTYKGAVFWDTEMFMLDFFLNTQPQAAKVLMQYRVDTLSGALKKAKQYGYQGAFYAWESQEEGFDACSDYNVTDVFTGRPMRTYFKDKQVHISAAIVYGIMKYASRTGDREFLYSGGAKTVIECAKFYDSLLVQKVHAKVYEIRDVIGPDEYHERVNNNGYTNRMAQYTFQCASQLLKQCEEDAQMAEALNEYENEELYTRFCEDAERIYIPKADADGIIPQFDGYRKLEDTTVDDVRSRLLNEKEYWGGAYGVASDTQIIKQADVITWMVMFPEDFTTAQKWENWSYYEPRTEHGSSLSACMYSILACVCGKPQEAYPLFLKSAQADLKGGGKEWAGDIYIGGTHPAAAGGAYMTAINGFGGVRIADGKVTATQMLPESWKKLKFYISYQNQTYEITETKENVEIKKIG